MTTYTLYQASNGRYVIANQTGCCTTTFLTRPSILWNIHYVDGKSSTGYLEKELLEEATVVTSFTTYEELVYNHPELLL